MAASVYMAKLIVRRDRVVADIEAMTKNTVGGKPNAMTSDGGTTVNHVQWRKSLYEELEWIDDAILRQSKIDAALAGEDGGWEFVSEGYAG